MKIPKYLRKTEKKTTQKSVTDTDLGDVLANSAPKMRA